MSRSSLHMDVCPQNAAAFFWLVKKTAAEASPAEGAAELRESHAAHFSYRLYSCCDGENMRSQHTANIQNTGWVTRDRLPPYCFNKISLHPAAATLHPPIHPPPPLLSHCHDPALHIMLMNQYASTNSFKREGTVEFSFPVGARGQCSCMLALLMTVVCVCVYMRVCVSVCVYVPSPCYDNKLLSFQRNSP